MAKTKVTLAASGANSGVQVLAANDEPLKASISGVNFRVGNFSSTNSSLLFGGKRSIEFMFSIDSIPPSNIAVFKDSLQGYPRSGVFVSRNNNLYVTLGGKIVIIPGNLKINHPYHIVLTIDPDNQEGKVYVDNVLIGSNTDFTSDQEPDNLFIGVLESSNTSLVTVSLCRLFNYILTTDDISELWNDGDPKSYVLPDSGLLNTGCVAEYLPKNIEDKVWVESGGSSSLNLSGTGDFDFTYKVGDVDGYQRLSIPWDPSTAGDNLYIFMNPDMHSQVCLIGSDENTISKTRQKTLTFQTIPLTGVVQDAQSVAELEVTQEEAVYTYEFNIASSVTGKLSAGGQNTILSANLVTFRNGVQVSTQAVNASYSIPATPGFTLSGSTLIAANRTTVVGGDRSVEVTGEFTTSEGIKVTDVISVTQAANTATYENPVVQLSYPVASAAGETILPGVATWTQEVTYTSGSTQSLSKPGTGAYSGSGVNTSTGAVVVSSKRATVSGVTTVTTATLTVTANGKTGSKDAPVTQAANAVTKVELRGSTEVFPASGANNRPFVNRITYTSGWSGEQADITFDMYSVSGTGFSIIANPTYPWGILANAANRTTVVGPQRTGVITLTYKGVSGSITLTQAANEKTYGDITISEFTYTTVAASGANATPTVGTITQKTLFTSGSSSSETITGTKSFALKTPVSGATMNASTGVVTWAPNTTESQRLATAVLTVTANGKTGTKEAVTSQAAGVKTYANPVVTLSYSVISAAGGTVNPTISYSQTWGWNGSTTGGGTITSGGSIVYSGSGVNTSTGAVTASSKGINISGVTTVTTATATVTLNGKSGTASKAVTQQENFVVKMVVNPNTLSLVYPTVPASGGKSLPSLQGGTVTTYTFTSGSTSTTVPDLEYGIYSNQSKSFSATPSGTFTSINTSTGEWTVSSKNTQVSDITNSPEVTNIRFNQWVPKPGYGNKVVSSDYTVKGVCKQAANTVTKVEVINVSGGTSFSAAGGTNRPFTNKITYTSGWSGEQANLTFDMYSVSGTGFSMIANPTYPWGVLIDAANRGTVVGPQRTGTITLTYRGVSGSITVTQEANVETLNGLLITAPNKDNVSYTGGTITWTANGTYKYTSGSPQTKSVAASAGTWSVTGAGATQSSNTTTWAQNLSEGSRTATVKFVVSGVTGTGTTTQLSQNLVVASYTNVVSTYSNSKAGYKAS